MAAAGKVITKWCNAASDVQPSGMHSAIVSICSLPHNVIRAGRSGGTKGLPLVERAGLGTRKLGVLRTVSSSPALDMKAGWVTLGKSAGDSEIESHLRHENQLGDFGSVTLSQSNSSHRVVVVEKIGGGRRNTRNVRHYDGVDWSRVE
ncbi:hypothetical protein L345_14573, partial [Ophiophagus hannah]